MENAIIKISMSNTKMGFIPSFSLPPVISCPRNAPCAKKGCYVEKLLRVRPALAASLKNNWNIVNRESMKCSIFEKQMNAFLDMYEPKVFRIHVSGDFFTTNYTMAWFRIAEAHPKVKFFAFTKQFANIRGAINIYSVYRKKLKNLTLIMSEWDGFKVPDDLAKKFPIARVVPRGTIVTKEMGTLCPGKCDECGLCFNRKKKDGDIVFYKH